MQIHGYGLLVQALACSRELARGSRLGHPCCRIGGLRASQLYLREIDSRIRCSRIHRHRRTLIRSGRSQARRARPGQHHRPPQKTHLPWKVGSHLGALVQFKVLNRLKYVSRVPQSQISIVIQGKRSVTRRTKSRGKSQAHQGTRQASQRSRSRKTVKMHSARVHLRCLAALVAFVATLTFRTVASVGARVVLSYSLLGDTFRAVTAFPSIISEAYSHLLQHSSQAGMPAYRIPLSHVHRGPFLGLLHFQPLSLPAHRTIQEDNIVVHDDCQLSHQSTVYIDFRSVLLRPFAGKRSSRMSSHDLCVVAKRKASNTPSAQTFCRCSSGSPRPPRAQPPCDWSPNSVCHDYIILYMGSGYCERPATRESDTSSLKQKPCSSFSSFVFILVRGVTYALCDHFISRSRGCDLSHSNSTLSN